MLRPLADAIEHRFVVAMPKGAKRHALMTEFVQHARSAAREMMRGIQATGPT